MRRQKLQLTREQDYAIRIINELCLTEAERLDVGTLSELTGVTPLFTQKIMRKLSAAGIVSSKKGANGGYALAEGRTPANTSLYDVFKAMNGDELFINACLSGSYECNRPDVVRRHGSCYIKRAMAILNEDIVGLLKDFTFEKLSRLI